MGRGISGATERKRGIFGGARAGLLLAAACGCAAPGGWLDRSKVFGRMSGAEASPVESLRVTFPSQGQELVGLLYFKPSQNAHSLPPPIIITGSWTTVKEQMPSSYAPLLAEAGFAALIFDFRGYGESGGEPREVESPRLKAQDIRAAVAFLQTNGGVDGRRIGVLAICASAGYAALAASDEPGIKSLALVAPWLQNRAIVQTMYGGEVGVRQRLEQGRVARQMFGESGLVSYIKVASDSDPSAAMFAAGDSLDYYLNPKRGAIPQWRSRFAVMAWPEWLQFDAIALAERLDVPTRIVTGEQTTTPEGAREFAARLKAPHDVVMLEGIQTDFYDQPRTVSSAAAAAIVHFRRTL